MMKQISRMNGVDQDVDDLPRSFSDDRSIQDSCNQSGEPAPASTSGMNRTPSFLIGLGLSITILSLIWDEPAGTELALAHTPAILEVEEDLTVAFLGDHGTGRYARRVFELIKTEGVDMVLSQGDLGYDSSPEAFERLIDETLGPDFPFFASLGNHDRRDWRRYTALLESRAERISGLVCEGQIGIKAACSYKGLFFITSAVKVFFFDSDFFHADFMSDQLRRTSSRWRICSWHFNQAAMQVGAKGDDAGWPVYEACRKGGAMIVTAHEHSYSRTHLISKFADPPQVSSYDPDKLHIEPGRSLAIVSGLAGRSARPQLRYDDWWAAAYTATQNAQPGALICRFNTKGRKDRADCAFKAINGDEPDRFTLTAFGYAKPELNQTSLTTSPRP